MVCAVDFDPVGVLARRANFVRSDIAPHHVVRREAQRMKLITSLSYWKLMICTSGIGRQSSNWKRPPMHWITWDAAGR
jgi:hypothetical protein